MKVKLGEICKVVSGSTPKTHVAAYWGGEHKWVTPAELKEDSDVITETERTLTREGVASAGLKALPVGTVLLSSRAPIGKVAIVGCEMYCNQGFKNLICSPSVYNRFLFWFLKSKKAFLNSLGRGATFTEISKQIVENIQINLPSLARQREIVRVLDKVEAVIDKHKRQLAKLDELVRARFVEMFGSTVANEKKWSTQKIETVAPAQCATQKQQTTVWLLNLDAVESHTGRILEYQYVDYTRVGPSTCCFDEKNVLYSKLRPYLNKVVLPDRPGMATSELIPLRPNDQVNRVFLAHMLRSDEFVAYIKEKVSGAKMPRVQMDEFRKFPMIIPPLPLQRQFAEFVTRVERMKGKVRASLEATQKLLGSLMQEYFS